MSQSKHPNIPDGNVDDGKVVRLIPRSHERAEAESETESGTIRDHVRDNVVLALRRDGKPVCPKPKSPVKARDRHVKHLRLNPLNETAPDPKKPRPARRKTPSHSKGAEAARKLSMPVSHERILGRMVKEGIQYVGQRMEDGYSQPNYLLEEAHTELLALTQIDYYTVAKILFQWRNPRFFTEQHIRSIVRLLREDRRASVIGVMRAMSLHAPDAEKRGSSPSGVTADDVLSEVSDEIDGVFDED